jgi:hypothetical protein
MPTQFDHSHIPGWGADLDPARRPAVPMERMPPRLEGAPFGKPAQQPQTVEVLHSIERPGITPVFGSSLPPRGLSGMVRRRAFRHSESNLRHWMMLMAADRIDVVEGLVADIGRRGRARPAASIAMVAGLLVLGAWCWQRR